MDRLPYFVAACLKSRHAHSLIAEANVVHDDVAKLIVKEIGDYYARDTTATSADRVTLRFWLSTRHETPAKAKYFREVLAPFYDALPTEVSAENVAGQVHLARVMEARARVAQAMLTGQDGDEELRTLRDIERQSVSSRVTQLSAEQILAAQSNRIAVHPRQLSAALNGGVAPGDCIIGFGRPGMGKTLLSANIAAGIARQGHTILHTINEEGDVALALRYLSLFSVTGPASFGGMNKPGVLGSLAQLKHPDPRVRTNNVGLARDWAYTQGMQHVHLVYGVKDIATLRALVQEYRPALVVADQVRHYGVGDSRADDLERVTQALRELAHAEQCVALGITQAGASAHNKLILEETDIDGAKTGLQGACDLLLGLGVDDNFRANGQRMFTICRNKISGVITSFPVFVDEQHTLIRNPPRPGE